MQSPTWRRLYLGGVVVALAFGALTLITAALADLPLRDPDGFLGPSYVRLPLIGLAMVALDVVPRVVARFARERDLVAVVRDVLRERLAPRRVGLISLGFGVFYVCYVSYRNLKSFLPFLRDELHDPWLVESDRWLAFGSHPGDMLHELLGTGASAGLLSFVYMAFLPLVPLSLAAALVWGDNVTRGAWYALALSLNWVLGTLTYYLLPALGPIYVEAYRFTDLPDTAVASLQDGLWRNRVEVMADPFATSSVHGVAAFASLHTSITLTAALLVTMTRMNTLVQWVTWGFFGLTAVATVYFGWHYVLDLFAGALVAVASVALARMMVGRASAASAATGPPRTRGRAVDAFGADGTAVSATTETGATR
ncbi:phosphatase PAP2 family protein [Jannaschia sp. R86511]|uniref:phosphatase PAP2 family protein n=1 Tax=Jannaschia sp. R86511 TaxID=3093853 RepID=UPI0036D2A244